VAWRLFLSYLPDSGVHPAAHGGVRSAAAEVTRRAGGGGGLLLFLFASYFHYSFALLLLWSITCGLHISVRAAWVM
jgi:hypothetical protein